MFKELEQEGGDGRSDADKEVDDNEEHISCRGDLEPKGCWVHDGGDGPPARLQSEAQSGFCSQVAEAALSDGLPLK